MLKNSPRPYSISASEQAQPQRPGASPAVQRAGWIQPSEGRSVWKTSEEAFSQPPL